MCPPDREKGSLRPLPTDTFSESSIGDFDWVLLWSLGLKMWEHATRIEGRFHPVIECTAEIDRVSWYPKIRFLWREVVDVIDMTGQDS